MSKLLSGKINRLSGNTLKIIALISMTADHIGVILFPSFLILRAIGRLAFPIFAYMLAEGYRYSKDKKRYFSIIFILASVLQIFYYLFERSLYQSVLVSFSLSIILMYIMDLTFKNRNFFCLLFLFLFSLYFVSEITVLYWNNDFELDYGFFGVLLPALVYLSDRPLRKLFFFFTGLILLSFRIGGIQWYSVASVILILMYNGEKGKFRMKWFFYIYYPLHLLVIKAIELIWFR